MRGFRALARAEGDQRRGKRDGARLVTQRVLVAEPIAEEGVEALRRGAEVEVRLGLPREELLAVIGGYDGLVVRSGTRVDRAVIAAAERLRVIGRAGAGVDNIDIEAATERGILVLNAPGGNTVSAAELAVGMLLAVSRHIASATASLRGGAWERQRFVGSELQAKTIGIVGLGQVGSSVARRLQAFETRLIAHDPFVPAERAASMHVQLMGLEELLEQSDVVTLHTRPTPGAGPLMGAEQFARMKPGALLVNMARGSLVDEDALWEALESEAIGGAALDVFAEEPAVGNRLIEHPRVLATPHLGASTQEAQERVALDLAGEMLRVLRGEPASNAVNAPFIDPQTLEAVGPYLGAATMCGRLCTQLARGQWRDVHVVYRGEIANYDVTPLKAAVVAGLLEPISDEHVNLVSVNNVIAQRGWRVSEQMLSEAEPYQSSVTVQLNTSSERLSLTGTIDRGRAAVVDLDGFHVHIAGRQAGHEYLLVLRNQDRPGRVGLVGTQLGGWDVNIRAMELGYDEDDPSADALMALTIDRALTAEELGELRAIDGVDDVVQATL